MSRTVIKACAAAVGTVALATAGCGPSGPQMESRPVVRVEGRVLVQGKPQKGIHVSFFPDDATQEARPHGTTDADGKYQLETYRRDGAPPGEYAVSLFWPAPAKEGDDGSSPPDRLGRKYADPKTSGHRATVATDPTVVPTIDLK